MLSKIDIKFASYKRIRPVIFWLETLLLLYYNSLHTYMEKNAYLSKDETVNRNLSCMNSTYVRIFAEALVY